MKIVRTGLVGRLYATTILFILVCATTALAQTSHSAEQYFKQGLSHYKNGDLDGAIRDFTRAIEMNSRRMKTPHPNVGRRSLVADGGESSADESVEVVDLFNAQAYYNRGVAWSDKGEIDRAIADFNRAIRIDPLCTKAYLRRGRCRHSKDDLDGALADFNKAITLDSTSAFAYNNRGIVRQAKEDLAGAMSDFEVAISLDPQLAEAHLNRGTARSMIGDLTGAIADLDLA